MALWILSDSWRSSWCFLCECSLPPCFGCLELLRVDMSGHHVSTNITITQSTDAVCDIDSVSSVCVFSVTSRCLTKNPYNEGQTRAKPSWKTDHAVLTLTSSHWRCCPGAFQPGTNHPCGCSCHYQGELYFSHTIQCSFFKIVDMDWVIFVKWGVLGFPGELIVHSLFPSHGVDWVNPVDFANFDMCPVKCATEPLLLWSHWQCQWLQISFQNSRLNFTWIT